MTGLIPRFILHLRCKACRRSYYAALRLVFPQACPACAGGRRLGERASFTGMLRVATALWCHHDYGSSVSQLPGAVA